MRDDKADLMTVKEVARKLRVHVTTVHAWLRNGIIDAVELPALGARRTFRIRRSAVEALFNSAAKKD